MTIRAERRFLWTPLLIACALGHPTVALGQGAPLSPLEESVRETARGFGAALARGDSTGALAMLAEDVLIREGGRAETKAQYRSGHLRADIAYASAVTSELLADAVTISGDVALYTRRYRTTGRYRDRDIDRTSNESMVLVRTADGWRIRLVHWE